jgi:hypothetical protein
MLAANADAARDWYLTQLASPITTPRAPALAALAQTLDTKDFLISGDIAIETWVRLVADAQSEQARAHLDEAARLSAIAFAAALAIDNDHPAAGKQLAAAFPPLHSAALKARLSTRAWTLLERRLPARRGREWDHAERLRDALVRAFQRPGWDPSLFVRALGDGDALLYTVHRCTQSEDGRRLLRSARDAVRNRKLSVTKRQREVLEGATKKRFPDSLAELFDRLLG